MRSNPMIRKGFDSTQTYDGTAMTIKGTKTKTIFMVTVTTLVAILTALLIFMSGNLSTAYTVTTVSSIAGFVLALVTCFNPRRAKTFGMLYALCEGAFIGSISLVFETMVPGIVGRTLILTLLAVVFTLLLYKQAPSIGAKIRHGVMIATLAILGVSLIGLIFSLFGVQFIFWGSSPIGIGFSLLVVGIAIANLIVDYDNIAMGAEQGLPDFMEWYFAFGILVTVVWLYIEILHLLVRIVGNNE